MKLCIALMLSVFVALVHADCYMHNPRGSNDRLNEPNNQRQNAERLFDSQNNNNGGYCWGPKMYYYTGSLLSIEWTNQHSCGMENNDCDIVLQYMCNPNQGYWTSRGFGAYDPVADIPRDGYPTGNTNQPNTPDYCVADPNAPLNTNPNTETAGEQRSDTCSPTRHDEKTTDGSDNYIYGLHETYEYYHDCYMRERNKGLFTANRNVNNNRGATASRQNNGGNNARLKPSQNGNANHGYECPEERDYWPYFHPQPWKDIAVLTTRTDECSRMRSASQNVADTYYCFMDTPPERENTNPVRWDRIPSSEKKCLENQGSWRRVGPLGGGKPDCLPAPWSRDNHLGNGFDGNTNRYNWTIPNDPNPSCVLRIRYNITTKDGQWKKRYPSLTSADNGAKSPVSDDPTPYISPNTEGTDMPPTAFRLELAIDTDQFGRTFQDRSHTFEIRARDSSIDPTRRIYNLNVRGKRGNIVQTYPAVEYDFVPQVLNIKTNDYIHVQWTGCDNGYGNGQDGEGRDKTDRSNMCSLLYNEIGANLIGAINDTTTQPLFFSQATHHALAWIGQTKCLTQEELEEKREAQGDNNDQKEDYIENCGKLNGAPTPYFDGGLIKIKAQQTWNYICSRNNNFSNRSQKGVINSQELVQTFGIVLLSISGAGFVAAVFIAVVAKFAPGSAIAASVTGV